MNLVNKDFIESDITDIIKDGVIASTNLLNGIQGYALSEYLLQSIFLKMTGYQEQKLKCICWDIASINYDFRYKLLNRMNISECSSKDDKDKVFKEIFLEIKNQDQTIEKPQDYINSVDIAKKAHLKVKELCEGTPLEFSNQHVFNDFKASKFFETEYSKWNSLSSPFEPKIGEFYERGLYRERNRCAHNLKSYQLNLPKLKDLRLQTEEKYDFFHYYTLLSILDQFYIKSYETIISKIQSFNW